MDIQRTNEGRMNYTPLTILIIEPSKRKSRRAGPPQRKSMAGRPSKRKSKAGKPATRKGKAINWKPEDNNSARAENQIGGNA